jgi:hypothetical protein
MHKRLHRRCAAPGAQPEVDDITLTIDGPIQIHPLAADLHVRFVNPRGYPDRAREPVSTPFKLRSIMVNPTHDRGVDHRQAALGHHPGSRAPCQKEI